MRSSLKLTLKRSKRFLCTCITFIVLVISFSACQKEFSFMDPGLAITDSLPMQSDSLAVYSLLPGKFNCDSIVSSGASQVGIPYTADNYVVIYVQVSKKGYWRYPATTLAGITYSGSGYFPDTGVSTIKLYGTGTPAMAGSFDYPLNVNNISCSFSNTVGTGSALPPADSNTVLYYKANIGGIDYYKAAIKGGGYRAGSSRNGPGDDVALSASISPATSPYPPDSTSLVVIKGLMHKYLSTDDAQFKSFFASGSYPFSRGTNNNAYLMGDGFYMEWIDGRGHEWNTLSGTGEQTNSVIKITSVTDYPDPLNYYIRVKLEFSCKLYRIDTGEMIQLNDGEFNGLFGKL